MKAGPEEPWWGVRPGLDDRGGIPGDPHDEKRRGQEKQSDDGYDSPESDAPHGANLTQGRAAGNARNRSARDPEFLMTRYAVIGLFLLVGLVTGKASAEAVAASESPAVEGADPILGRLQSRIDSLRTLEGSFIQRLDSRLGQPRVETGTFAIKKPSLMRWDYRSPEVKIAITDGRETWLYLPEDRELHRGAMPEGGQGAAAQLMAGTLDLDRAFHASRPTDEEDGTGGGEPPGVAGGIVIELTPREPTDEFERLVLVVEQESLQIRRVTLIDAVGGRMTFEFFDLRENTDLSDDIFDLEPPPGVEIIDTR